MYSLITPADFQSSVLAWLAVVTVVLAGVTGLAVKAIGFYKAVKDAVADLHAKHDDNAARIDAVENAAPTVTVTTSEDMPK